MAHCAHCGTRYTPTVGLEEYCCKGCEFVAGMIGENGFEQFYDLKQGLALAPVRSRPFEEHDFGWLAGKVAESEAKAAGGGDAARLDLALEGISCVGCVWLVEKLFQRQPGGIRAVAHPASGRLHLEWSVGQCDIEGFLKDLVRFGYVAAPAGAVRGDHERRRLGARLGLCGAFALNTMGFTLPGYLGMEADFEFAGLFRLIAFLSATLSMLVGGGYFMDRAWRSLRAGSLHIDLPIALGLLAAYAGSIAGWVLGDERLMYFDFVATFVFLMLGGRYLQSAAVEKNRRRLVRQQPVPEAVPLADGGGTVDRDAILPGVRFLLGPGQALPVSGILAEGEADFSLEWIHGEAEPVRFTAGRRMSAGSILLSRSPVVIDAEERWEDSLLARLTAPSTEDRSNPGLEKLLRVYLMVVLVLGLVALGWWIYQGDALKGVQAMISVFVVSCPCALGVAIPFADDLAASAMERLGVFVRSATLWARLRRVRRVVFDKTGTLTLERPVLENPEAIAELDDEAAGALAELTRGSLHPISRSLLESLGVRGQRLLEARRMQVIEEFPGLGVRYQEEFGTRWSLGRVGWDGNGPTANGSAREGSELRRNGETVAAFHFQEALRPGAVECLRMLGRRGLSLHVLSGDHADKVKRNARALGIPDAQAHGGLSPQDKAHAMAALDQRDSLYLGDGANDSLAFDQALVTGTPVVDRSLLESKADFFTLGNGLDFLPKLMDAAHARAKGVKSAFAFALAYNATTVGFSMAGHMSPLLAAILMPLSSIVSILIVARSSKRAQSDP